jgi:hypothetical protein
LDLPGIIEGAKDGKGRGKQVIAGKIVSDLPTICPGLCILTNIIDPNSWVFGSGSVANTAQHLGFDYTGIPCFMVWETCYNSLHVNWVWLGLLAECSKLVYSLSRKKIRQLLSCLQ